jgi:microcystin degradation protein MlrC
MTERYNRQLPNYTYYIRSSEILELITFWLKDRENPVIDYLKRTNIIKKTDLYTEFQKVREMKARIKEMTNQYYLYNGYYYITV